jgi:hypothetical protein
LTQAERYIAEISGAVPGADRLRRIPQWEGWNRPADSACNAPPVYRVLLRAIVERVTPNNV